jgi:hypothetical protein
VQWVITVGVCVLTSLALQIAGVVRRVA